MPSRPLFLLSVALAGLLLAACGKSEEQQQQEPKHFTDKDWSVGKVDRTARHGYTFPTPPGEKPLFTNPADNPECISFEKFMKAGNTLVPEDQAAYARDCAAKAK